MQGGQGEGHLSPVEETVAVFQPLRGHCIQGVLVDSVDDAIQIVDQLVRREAAQIELVSQVLRQGRPGRSNFRNGCPRLRKLVVQARQMRGGNRRIGPFADDGSDQLMGFADCNVEIRDQRRDTAGGLELTVGDIREKHEHNTEDRRDAKCGNIAKSDTGNPEFLCHPGHHPASTSRVDSRREFQKSKSFLLNISANYLDKFDE